MVASLQGTCIVFVVWGIIFELLFGADLGYLMITGGSLAFAVATKLHALEDKHRK